MLVIVVVRWAVGPARKTVQLRATLAQAPVDSGVGRAGEDSDPAVWTEHGAQRSYFP
jgi:hypothetical protein